MQVILSALIGPLLRLGLIMIGDSILSKWIALWRFELDKAMDPVIKRKVRDEYAVLEKSIDDSLDQRPPPP